MEKALLLLILKWCVAFSKEVLSEKEWKKEGIQSSQSDKVYYEYVAPIVPFSDVTVVPQQLNTYGFSDYVPPSIPLLPEPKIPKLDLHSVINGNQLLTALLLSASLELSPKSATSNHPELLPINPYIALLLSQYGRYVPSHGAARGIYAYAASNNYHNNKPFGSYKVYEDAK